MILQELCAYYNRLRQDRESGIAPPGFSSQQISFAIVLDRQGELVQIQDIRDTSGKKPRPVMMSVPEPVLRSVNVAANFLWDKTGYVLGADMQGNPDRTKETFQAFVARQHEIGDRVDDVGMNAVLAFLDSWSPGTADSIPQWEEVAGANVVFRLADEHRYIHERPALVDAWTGSWQSADGDDPSRGMCLITGQERPIAKLHNRIKGVRDAQSSGASIVSFNLPSFCSYGKEQSYNAPIGREAAFEYTTALNRLLRFESRQRIQIADATTVFWASAPTPMESFLGPIVDSGDPRFADSHTIGDVERYLRAVRSGRKPDWIDESVRFYILGLSPNASRIAVRFWYATTVDALDRAIEQHFADLEMVRQYDNQEEFPCLRQLLLETAPLRRTENINPNLAGAMTRSMLTGTPYPSFLLATLLNRIRADREIGYYRAALIKATLLRSARSRKRPMEVSEVLNESSTDVAYRLGRLFAVLEKAQQDALPGVNATIKDRYYGSASATPAVVFPQLLRLNQHHTAKLEGGLRNARERLIQDISDEIDHFPTHLPLESQGMFALGYYQQRKALFTKRIEKEEE